MISDVYCKETDELFETPIIQQSGFWSALKKKLGLNSIAINFKVKSQNLSSSLKDGTAVLSDLLVIIHRLNNQLCYAYVPYGPEIEPSEEFQGAFLEELSECLRSYLPLNCMFIRYDLCWESFWAKENDYYDQNGWWIGPPEKSTQELRFNINTQKWNFRKSPTNNLPSSTLFLSLHDDSNVLLNQMKPKTRYNIGLSIRKGVTVRSVGAEYLPTWYKMYQETATRNNFYLHNIEYFHAVFLGKLSNQCEYTDVMLLLAEMDNYPLAAMFLVISGKRASYLYGASTSEHRNLMATYALQWKAMSIARERGCIEYDMFGVAPCPDPSHPLSGLYRFKTGFGGELFHRLGCWDYPIDIEKYEYFVALEKNSQGYHLN